MYVYVRWKSTSNVETTPNCRHNVSDKALRRGTNLFYGLIRAFPTCLMLHAPHTASIIRASRWLKDSFTFNFTYGLTTNSLLGYSFTLVIVFSVNKYSFMKLFKNLCYSSESQVFLYFLLAHLGT